MFGKLRILRNGCSWIFRNWWNYSFIASCTSIHSYWIVSLPLKRSSTSRSKWAPEHSSAWEWGVDIAGTCRRASQLVRQDTVPQHRLPMLHRIVFVTWGRFFVTARHSFFDLKLLTVRSRQGKASPYIRSRHGTASPFSAVSTPIPAIKYSLESSSRDL